MPVTRTLLAVVLSAVAPAVVAGLAGGELELRGRVVCLDGAGAVRTCEPPGDFALQTSGGELRLFGPADPLAAMFADPDVRNRELLVRARPAAEGTGNELNIIKVYSIRDGRTHDLDYFCEVCNVVAYAPGLCVCCRQPLVLRERPLP
jgi:hypothetical protein